MPLMTRGASVLALAIAIGASGLVSSREASAQDATACVDAANAVAGLRKAKQLGEARSKLLVCAQEACDTIVRDDCKKWLAEVEAARPSLVFTVKDGNGADLTDVRITANGQPLADRLDGTAVSIDPGEYELSFEAKGVGAAKQRVLVVEGQKSRLIEVVLGGGALPPPAQKEEPASLAPFAWTTFGIGAAGLVAFGVLQGVAQSEYAEFEDSCGRTRACTDTDVAPTRDKFIASMAMLGVGGAGIVTAAILFIVDATSKEHPDSAASLRIGVAAWPGGAALGLVVPLSR